MIKLVIIILLTMMLASCETYDFIDVINECETEVVVDYGLDTIPHFENGTREYYLTQGISNGETERFTQQGVNGWERYMKENNRNSIFIYIYRLQDIQEHENIDSLITKNLYEKMEITIIELEQNDYDIYICK